MDKQLTPIASPDTLRKTLKMLKRYYSGYTDKYKGYTDVNGYKYNGTIENFGSEIYFESRKLLMERPPIGLVFPGNTFNFYFDISYSELVSTYEQQNMFVATLKDDVLRSNCIYKIIFRDCVKKYVLRSESWSDPDVYHDSFIMTHTKPVLQIQIPNGDSYDTEEIELMVSNDDSYDIIYSFNDNLSSHGLIDTYDEVNGILTTREITYRDVNIPMIWIYSDAFNVLPDIGFVNNYDMNGETLLTIGTDGHNKCYLYPLIYENNYPSAYDPEDGLHWFIKVTPSDDASFVDDSSCDINYTSHVGTITFIRSEYPWSEPTVSRTITYDDTYTQIFLSHDIDWNFHKPIETDYDYDGLTHINRTYAYITLDEFINNTNINLPCMACFYVTFDKAYLNPYEKDLSNIVSGFHIETCSDYSDNGVLKKNGFIHSLGDFDGLPSYYKLLCDKDEHRSHVEMFSIRDYINDNNKNPINKQTSAIILDSGVPKRDLNEVLNELNKVIVYDVENVGTWKTVGESISSSNYLTSMVYLGNGVIADDTVKGMANKPHFIYHGNGFFSLEAIAFDPELETARGMLITNDPSSYENNGKTSYVKPTRTIARICDIPTEFSQLIHITGISPTVIIDEHYVRQYASMNDDDKNRLWNYLQNKWCTSVDSLSQSIGIFDNTCDLDNALHIDDQTDYTQKINLNSDIPFSSCTVDVAVGGESYVINDEFTFYLGGKLITGIVTGETDGVVESVSLDIDPLYRINIANLVSSITTFTTTTINGDGHGLKIDIIVPELTWQSLQQKASNVSYDNLFTLKFDKYGFLWFWRYDTHEQSWFKDSQLTGPNIIPNQYDDISTIKKRSCGDVMLYNMLNVRNVLNNHESELHSHTNISPIPISIPLDNITTFSGPNYQSSYYVLDRFPNEQSQLNYRVTYWNHFDYTNNTKLLPAYNQLNTSNHSIRGDALQWLLNDTKQPALMYFNPILENKITYNETCDSIWDILSNKKMTYRDILGSGWINDEGVCIAPIYRYNEFTPSDEYLSFVNEVNMMSHTMLINYLRNNFPTSYILSFEETDPIPDDEIKLYIIDNYYNNPVYKCNDIYRVHNANDVVVINDEPVGDKPCGDYMPLVETHSPNITYVNKKYTTEILFIFRLDRTIDLNGFIITNDENTDISRNSLILMNGDLYYYDDSRWNILS